MVKGKNRGGPVAAGPKQPKPAAAKPGVVKATARCHKPTGTFPPAGKENKNALAKSDVSEKGKKRVRVPEGTAPPDKDDCQEQQEKGGKRKRHQPTRFASRFLIQHIGMFMGCCTKHTCMQVWSV